MAKMKTEFELREYSRGGGAQCGTVKIGDDKTLTVNTISGRSYYLKPQDLERFAVNILKALNSKQLKK